MLTIDATTARRFVLGKQGLWPGRRFRGLAGTEQAMRAMEYLQLDPLQVVARSHDIALYSRVIDYRPGMWEIPTYRERRFFDWGGWLATRPMEELPHWRVVMRRERDGGPGAETRVSWIGREHAAAIEEMRQLLRERGTVSNRDFDMASRTRTNSYRGRKDSALALYYLWRTGEAMTHHRVNFERVYALTEAVAPPELIYESPEDEADRFLVKKEIAFYGLARLGRASEASQRGVPFGKGRQIVADLLAAGEMVEMRVEGWKGVCYALAGDVPVLEELAAGRVPAAWKPLETTTEEEATFLAPLDPVSARGRAKVLFDFDYVWEVYKPEHQRRYGYYALPVLWGDRLVARFDSRMDRQARRLVLQGLWLEEETLAADEAFVEALAAGFQRFLRFLGAETLDAGAITESRLRARLGALKNG
ncbi:MAG TPA: crosslink repair DNA glycosylase YcaQ family protein [Limnochordales bacterium]